MTSSFTYNNCLHLEVAKTTVSSNVLTWKTITAHYVPTELLCRQAIWLQ